MSTTVTVRVPIKVRRQGSRKAIVTPEGTLPMPARVDVTLVKALARAFRWRRMLETGVYGTIAELAKAERINASYVSRVLRLTLLDPKIVEAILDGQQVSSVIASASLTQDPMHWHRACGVETHTNSSCCPNGELSSDRSPDSMAAAASPRIGNASTAPWSLFYGGRR